MSERKRNLGAEATISYIMPDGSWLHIHSSESPSVVAAKQKAFWAAWNDFYRNPHKYRSDRPPKK